MVGVVLLELAALKFRAVVAFEFMLVLKVVVAGVKEQNLPLPSLWGSSTHAVEVAWCMSRILCAYVGT